MDSYKLIWVKDAHARPVQISIPKLRVKQAAIGAAVLGLIGLVMVWDYWRLRADNAELAGLRVEAFEQREQIAKFRNRLEHVDDELARVSDLERKVRIIANLPGAAGVGGQDLIEPKADDDGTLAVPVGVPLDAIRTGSDAASAPDGQGGGGPLPVFEDQTSSAAPLFDRMDDKALDLAEGAEVRAESLEGLLEQLDDKRQRLVSMPSIWPARGWLTSRFGPRVSPFTGRRQLHAGIDIAAAGGTPIYAPARGRVTFAGRKGPLGNALVVDHGYGVKTVYGHTSKLDVKAGDTIERGQKIGEIGSTGRSTGPHLHYAVEVHGKLKDPLDYIFD